MPEATQGHDGGSEHPSGIAWHSMQQMLVLVLPLCSAVHEWFIHIHYPAKIEAPDPTSA